MTKLELEKYSSNELYPYAEECRRRLFRISEILVDHSKAHITSDRAIEKIRKAIRGEEE